MFRKLSAAGILFTCLICANLFAVDPTRAGTLITATEITVSTDTGYVVTGNPAWQSTVNAIHGFEIVPSAPQTVTISSVQVVLFPHKIINQSNTDDMEVITWDATGVIPEDWTYVYTLEDQVTTIDPAEISLAGQTSFNFYLKLTPIIANHSQAKVSFGSTINAVAYTGFNGNPYGGVSTADVSDNIVADVVRMGLNLTAYLEGAYYYWGDSGKGYPAGYQENVTINVQFRTVKNVDSGVSYNIGLDHAGQGSFRSNDIPTGDYYICVRQYLPGLPLGVNHAKYVSSESITVVQDVMTTINVSDSLDTGSLFLTANIGANGVGPMTNINGKYQLKGGDATGEGIVNIVDLVNWGNSMPADRNKRGLQNFSEKANFDADTDITMDDFNVWSRNKGQIIKLPEEE